MAKRIIDLKNVEELPRLVAKTRDEAWVAGAGDPVRRDRGISDHTLILRRNADDHHTSVQWSASERHPRSLGHYWYLYLGGLATLLIVFGILTDSYLFIIFVALSFTVLGLYLNAPPRVITYMVAHDGIHIGAKRYDYRSLKTYWIFDTLLPSELSVETSGLLNQFIRIPLEGVHIGEIRAVIGRFLEEKQHEDTLFDQVARLIGL